MRDVSRIAACAAIVALLACGPLAAAEQETDTPAGANACATNAGGITLPPGFCATVFADNLGQRLTFSHSPRKADSNADA